MIKKNELTCCLLSVILASCSMAPTYERPAMPMPDVWAQAPVDQDLGEPFDASWEHFFVSPTLKQLIAQALENNRDLRIAALNIEKARATYRIRWADRLPTVTAGVTETQALTPKALSSTQTRNITRKYEANLGITAFELDLFGRVASLNESALESYFSTKEARAAAQTSLIAEVANAYLAFLGDRKLLDLAEKTLLSHQKSLALIKESFNRGVSSEIEVAQAQALVENARAQRATYEQRVDQDKNALTLLIGAPVDEKVLSSDPDFNTVRFIRTLRVGLPSEVLLSRPDILQAEHTLKAANANIGAARAAFFPTLSLTATGGFASPTLNALFHGVSGAWSFVPNVSMPIFDSGRNIANLDVAQTENNIAVANYEKAIQSAFREVSDALAAKKALTEQTKAQETLVQATQTSLNLSQARYQHGLDSYLSVLSAERTFYSAKQGKIVTQIEAFSNLITLYKTLGGGRS
ncbi:MAG: efflux transporter outer membrane subunit [Alphaproteobacteria bacterium]|nr:efflux transporter outer membrane subunit [Alphaproteobacteria bacterium]